MERKNVLSVAGIMLAVFGLLLVASHSIAPWQSMFLMTTGLILTIFSIRDWWEDSPYLRDFYSAAIIGIMIFAVGFWELQLAQREKLIQQTSVFLLGANLMSGVAVVTMVLSVKQIFRSLKERRKNDQRLAS